MTRAREFWCVCGPRGDIRIRFAALTKKDATHEFEKWALDAHWYQQKWERWKREGYTCRKFRAVEVNNKGE